MLFPLLAAEFFTNVITICVTLHATRETDHRRIYCLMFCGARFADIRRFSFYEDKCSGQRVRPRAAKFRCTMRGPAPLAAPLEASDPCACYGENNPMLPAFARQHPRCSVRVVRKRTLLKHGEMVSKTISTKSVFDLVKMPNV